MKTKLSFEELKKGLEVQLEFVENSCKLYDDGHFHEGLRIAVAINLILINSTNQKSILYKILKGKINNLKLYSTNTTIMRNVNSYDLLTYGIGDHVKPYLDCNNISSTKPGLMKYQDWLSQNVICLSENRLSYPITRCEIIRTARDNDGGAHLDDKAGESYLLLKNGIPIARNEKGKTITTGRINLASLRQLGYEILNSNLLKQI